MNLFENYSYLHKLINKYLIIFENVMSLSTRQSSIHPLYILCKTISKDFNR